MNQQFKAEIDEVSEDMVLLYLEEIDKYLDLPIEIFDNADLSIGKVVNFSLKVQNKNDPKREVVETIGGFIKNPKKQELA